MDSKVIAAGPLFTPSPNSGIRAVDPADGGLAEEWSDDNAAEIAAGYLLEADTFEELAEKINAYSADEGYVMEGSALAATVSRYNGFCASGEDADFGRPAQSGDAANLVYTYIYSSPSTHRRSTRCACKAVGLQHGGRPAEKRAGPGAPRVGSNHPASVRGGGVQRSDRPVLHHVRAKLGRDPQLRPHRRAERSRRRASCVSARQNRSAAGRTPFPEGLPAAPEQEKGTAMDQRPGILAAAFALAAAAALLTGCQAPQPTGEDEADGAQPAAAWSPEADCGSCHVKEGSSFQSTATALAHAASSCLDCHTNATALESAHAEATEGAETPSKLSSNARISPDTCLGCHDQTETQEDLARSAVLVDEEGRRSTPTTCPKGTWGRKSAAPTATSSTRMPTPIKPRKPPARHAITRTSISAEPATNSDETVQTT